MGVRVGPEVRARGVGGEQRHGHGGQPGEHRRDGERGEAAGEQEQQHEQQRPQHVELRLDRKAPQVAQQRRRCEAIEVRLAFGREPPVHHRRERCERIAAQRPVPQRAVVDRGEDREPGQHDQRCGQEPAHPPAPEPRQVTAPFARPFANDQRRDEEAGEDEEHVDAQPTARQPRTARVEHHDREHRDAAQPVERGVP